jgi:hypothetical protein
VERNRRNRETCRLAEEERRRTEEAARTADERAKEEQRRTEEAARATNEQAEERERAARRARIQNRWIVLQARYLLSSTAEVAAAVGDFARFLQEYGKL